MAKKPAAKSAAQKAAATRAAKRKGAADVPRTVGGADGRKDLSVRKIENGYLVRQSEYRGGKYVERETFTPTAPKITIANAPKGKP